MSNSTPPPCWTGRGPFAAKVHCIATDSYAEALEYSEQALAVAVAPIDKDSANFAKGAALILLRRVEEGALLLDEQRRWCVGKGYLYIGNSTEVFLGLGEIMRGSISDGIRAIQESILRRDKEGYRSYADWSRLFLSAFYKSLPERKDCRSRSL